MRSLFLRIFLWFWLAMALASGTMIVMTHTAGIGPIAGRHRRIELERDRVLGQALSIYGQEAINTYNEGGPPALQRFTRGLDTSAGMRLYLFEDGALISGGAGPSQAMDRLAAMVRGGKGGNSMAWGKGYLLVTRLVGPQPAAERLSRSGWPAARRHIYEVAGWWPGKIPLRLGPPGRPFGFYLLISFIMSGIVSYGLAWGLSAPIGRLRQTTHELASGNLTARAGPELGGRTDEIGALARDFDGMAGRIESLVAAQQRLIRDISHELRSPLARLRVALELARQRQKQIDPPPKNENAAAGFLDRIERECERLDSLISEIVTLTLLESGAELLESGAVDLSLLVVEIADDAGFEARGMNRELEVRVFGEAKILGSAEMLRRAIENVVRNALRYTPEGGRVEIEMDCVPEGVQRSNGQKLPRVRLRVRDHGPGVPEDALKEIFRPFYRVADARERLTGGAGLGLAITERAVRLHGGNVTARNAPGGGLLVEIDLPEETAPSH